MFLKPRFLNCSMFLLIFAVLAAPLESMDLKPDKDFQIKWCDQAGGEIGEKLEDGLAMDCLTPEYAVKFTSGEKWAEAFGQILYYSQATGKRVGIVMILERESDNEYWRRLNRIIDRHHLGIKTWAVSPRALEPE